jgi:BON domain
MTPRPPWRSYCARRLLDTLRFARLKIRRLKKIASIPPLRVTNSRNGCHNLKKVSQDGGNDEVTNMKIKSYFCVLGLVIPISTALTGCFASSHKTYNEEDGASHHYDNYERTGRDQSTDDTAITNKVKAVFYDDSSLNVTQINVETHRGVVRLSGYVDNHDQIKRAEADASKVQGVQSVRNDLHVK